MRPGMIYDAEPDRAKAGPESAKDVAMTEAPPVRLDDQTIDGEIMVVLVNAEDQYSLWPAAAATPEGWTLVHPPAARADCLAYVEAHWTDMRPASLREAMARDPAQPKTASDRS